MLMNEGEERLIKVSGIIGDSGHEVAGSRHVFMPLLFSSRDQPQIT